MKYLYSLLIIILLSSCSKSVNSEIANCNHYLDSLKSELSKKWPNNKTVNIVFHGHSVPTGYFTPPIVKSLEAYPFRILKKLKTKYPYAVINIINTGIGGENSFSGLERFDTDVLNHKPDVIFIDYALNDINIGLEKAYNAWNKMIIKAKDKNIKIILLTPSPDLNINLLDTNSILAKHQKQIIHLAKENGIGLIDTYEIFKNKALLGDSITTYMSHVNHPNEKGHELIAHACMKYF